LRSGSQSLRDWKEDQIYIPPTLSLTSESSHASPCIKNCAILLYWFPLFFIANNHTAIISTISQRERERERERENKSPIKYNPNLHFKSIVNWRSIWYSAMGLDFYKLRQSCLSKHVVPYALHRNIKYKGNWV
jgi:hypothetical protein